jgi:two-component system chemotaxis response regulator CheB
LWELQDGELLRFRCRVGHAFSPDSLSAVQNDALEEALWIAYRALRENAALSERLATRARSQGLHGAYGQYRRRAEDATERANTIERVLSSEGSAEKDSIEHAEAPTETRPNVS